MNDDPLKRIRELLATASDATSRDSFAYNFDASLESNPIKRKILRDYEYDLLSLDDAAWETLKIDAAKRLIRIKKRGWEPLFDVLNEAKGYKHLKKLGCVGITFITPSYKQKSPDLMAYLNNQKVFCEVKTVNISDDERARRASGGVSSKNSLLLPQQFLTGKVTNTIAEAKAQLETLAQAGDRCIVYLVFHSDDSLNEDVEHHSQQMAEFLRGKPIEGVEVEFFMFPAFYTATS